MISLLIKGNQNNEFLRITKNFSLGEDYNVYFGFWWNGHNDTPQFQTKDNVVMSRNDLLLFAEEINKFFKLKSINEVELNLHFSENKPKFKLFLQYISKKNRYYDNNKRDLIMIKVGFCRDFSGVKLEESGFEDGEWDYENSASIKFDGKFFWFLKEYVSFEDLLRFSDLLMAESKT